MPVLAFLPWATTTRPLRFGKFVLLPFEEVLRQQQQQPDIVPPEVIDAAEAILEGYGHVRPVDRARVAVLQVEGRPVLDDLTDAEIGAVFAFRQRLAFAALARRDYFGLRYSNADALRLVVQQIDPARPGAAVTTSRRRDGRVTTMYTTGAFRVRRPEHVPWCELTEELDAGVLHATERALEVEGGLPTYLDEAMALFVGANTDHPDVAVHAELVDTTSAFSRLAKEWKAEATVDGFLRLLPVPPRPLELTASLTTRLAPARKTIPGTRPVRSAWLHDAFVLRHHFGHGRVQQPGFTPTWSVAEHLLLAAWIFPVALKAALATQGTYKLTAEDHFRDRSFDSLAALAPFAPIASEDPGDREKAAAWHVAMAELRMRFAGEGIERLWYEEQPMAVDADEIEGDAANSKDG
jgi:hypothetical protein